MEITKDSLIEELLEAYPETRAVFASLGMDCIDCMGASMETVETGACMHDLDVAVVLEALRRAIRPA